LTTGVIAALAIGAPVAEASAATPFHMPAFNAPAFHLPAIANLPAVGALPAFHGSPLSFVGPSVGSVGVAIGPTVIGSVFNGGTTVVVSTAPAAGSVIGSP
jgi:hypothetical protein